MNAMWSRKLVKIVKNCKNKRDLTTFTSGNSRRRILCGFNNKSYNHGVLSKCCQILHNRNPTIASSSSNQFISQVETFRWISTLRGEQIDQILKEVKDRDGLTKSIPHIEYLIGSSRDSDQGGGRISNDDNNGNSNGNTLDISDKTQLILQSSHPVRYIIEREIRALEYANNLELKYLDWVTLFGRSLLTPQSRDKLTSSSNSLLKGHEERLGKVATASECGMFSADVHQTIVNISANFPPGKIRSEFNHGNKYAVLVGDFFAIKTIYFAEKVKSSPVFLEIIRGVEDFTYSSFAGALLDEDIGYPILPSANARVKDWTAYNVKVAGYFTGGLKAAFTLNSLLEDSLKSTSKLQLKDKEEVNINLKTFVSNLSLVLKIIGDLQEFQENQNQKQLSTKNISPFLLVTLPAILYQQKYPQVFQDFRNSCTDNYEYDSETVRQIRQRILDSDAIPETKEMLRIFAQNADQAFDKLGKDDYYSEIVHKLLSLAIHQ